MKKIVGFIFILIGIALIGAFFYIKSRTEEGSRQVQEAQSKVDLGNKLFSLNPVTKQAGGYLSAPMQQRIDAAIEEIGGYEEAARVSKIGGIVFLIVGGLLILVPRKRHL